MNTHTRLPVKVRKVSQFLKKKMLKEHQMNNNFKTITFKREGEVEEEVEDAGS